MLYLQGYVPLLLPAAYGVMSLITFLMYAVDKGAAEKGNRRVPEGRLHLFELLYGWPDAEFARQALAIKPVMLIRI